MTADGGSSPMVKPKGDKQVEYLDLDLDPGKSTPPRKVRPISLTLTHAHTNKLETDLWVFLSRRRVMGLVWQCQMSGWTTWWWTSSGHRPSRAPGRPGTTDASPQRQTPPPKGPSDPQLTQL